jgi:hypothetical protein
MKQAAYPDIARSLLDVEKSIRVEKGIENGSEMETGIYWKIKILKKSLPEFRKYITLCLKKSIW